MKFAPLVRQLGVSQLSCFQNNLGTLSSSEIREFLRTSAHTPHQAALSQAAQEFRRLQKQAKDPILNNDARQLQQWADPQKMEHKRLQTIQPEGIGEWAKESGDIRKRSGRVAVERMRKLRNVSVLARELEIDLHKNANGGIEPPRYANPS